MHSNEFEALHNEENNEHTAILLVALDLDFGRGT